jgi:hypothetical protein
MISFRNLSAPGLGLGNTLFQYAFLRTSAHRLGVRFYCPPWIGDTVFCLDDQDYRVETLPDHAMAKYEEPSDYTGLNTSALRIGDETDIDGYFQTERYFRRDLVLNWYRFKEEAISSIRRRYEHVDFAQSVGLGVRLGDFATTEGDLYYVPRRDFYTRALALVARRDRIVVFSDDIHGAREFLGDLEAPTTYIDDYRPYEGLFLHSRCRDFICSPSTYSWWGAWLIPYPDRVIVAPEEGPFRPGAPVANRDYWPENWITIPALRRGLDHYRVVTKKRLGWRGLRRARDIARGADRGRPG